MKKNHRIIFLAIFALAAFFRLYGTNWDQGQHLHPDERFLTMVTQTIEWPKTIGQYFDASSSPLNPHNKNFSFFVYGLFPLLFVKFIAEHFNLADYANLTLIGRQLSGLVDLGTTILVFLIAKNLITQKNKLLTGNHQLLIPCIAMFFYAVSVLPIQLSHFYATDPYLTFFITLTFYLGTKLINSNRQPSTINHQLIYTVLMGISFGLVLASKISGALFLPILLIFLFISSLHNVIPAPALLADRKTGIRTLRGFLISRSGITKNLFSLFFSFSFCLFVFLSFSYLFLRIGSPYTFATNDLFNPSLNPKVVDNWKELKAFDGVDTAFPPALQWIPTKPYIYPLTHLVFWGLGLPLGILSLIALLYQVASSMYQIYRNKRIILDTKFLTLNTSVFWILLLFIYQGGQFAKALRYLYPFFPFSSLIAGFFFINMYLYFLRNKKNYFIWLARLFIITVLIWALGFITIYTRNHSRVSASKWIYNNIPTGATVANETWDDPQPLNTLDGDSSRFHGTMLSIYDPDSPEKWDKIFTDLSSIDYIFLTSNRLWRSLSAISYKYPYTAKYYQLLFSGKLGYEPIATFTSYLCLLPKNLRIDIEPDKDSTNLKPSPFSLTSTSYCYLALNDDGAEESFTVYDHPKVVIFQKKKHFSASELKNILFSSVYASQK